MYFESWIKSNKYLFFPRHSQFLILVACRSRWINIFHQSATKTRWWYSIVDFLTPFRFVVGFAVIIICWFNNCSCIFILNLLKNENKFKWNDTKGCLFNFPLRKKLTWDKILSNDNSFQDSWKRLKRKLLCCKLKTLSSLPVPLILIPKIEQQEICFFTWIA